MAALRGDPNPSPDPDPNPNPDPDPNPSPDPNPDPNPNLSPNPSPSPNPDPGDVRKLKHMRTPELEALLRGVDACRMHAVFFSTQGERADADKIAGCDHDGDKFTIISDPVLVSLFAEAPPWDAPQSGLINAVKPSEDPNALQCQLISQVLNARYKSSPLVGQSALSLMALSGTWHGDGAAQRPPCISLTHTHAHACMHTGTWHGDGAA